MYKYQVATALLFLEFGFEIFCTSEAEKVLARCPVYISRAAITAAERKHLLQYVLKKTAKEERQANDKPYHHAMIFRRVTQRGREEIDAVIQDDRVLTKFFLKYKPRYDRSGARRY